MANSRNYWNILITSIVIFVILSGTFFATFFTVVEPGLSQSIHERKTECTMVNVTKDPWWECGTYNCRCSTCISGPSCDGLNTTGTCCLDHTTCCLSGGRYYCHQTGVTQCMQTCNTSYWTHIDYTSNVTNGSFEWNCNPSYNCSDYYVGKVFDCWYDDRTQNMELTPVNFNMGLISVPAIFCPLILLTMIGFVISLVKLRR